MFKKFKIPYLNVVPILIIAFFLFKAINNLEYIVTAFETFLNVVSPFIYAFAFAYIFNPLVKYIERKFKLKRIPSLFITYLLIISIITLTITIVTPKIVSNIGDLIELTPEYISKVEIWLNNYISNNMKFLEDYGIIDYIDKNLTSGAMKFVNTLNIGINIALDKAISFTSSFLKVILGFLISMYILKDRELFIVKFKQFLYSILDNKTVDNIVHFAKEVDEIFFKYISGKALDSLIIALICYVGLKILSIPFAILISLIVGITNMIPYFGPFIGMIPSIIITLFYNPVKALTVAIFILILQQVDGWIIGPKILGDKVGLGPFWVILAIIIGGKYFGVLGMFLGVPVMAVINMVLTRFVENRLSNKTIKK